VEEVEFEGMFDNTSAGTSALWIPSLITGTVI
jgi:hypothetical protein